MKGVSPDLIIDKIENNIIMGRGRWLATFTDIYRNHKHAGKEFLLYAYGDTYEKGFFLSRIFSFFISPRRKVHYFVDRVDSVSDRYLTNLIDKCMKKANEDDYILLTIITNEDNVKGSIRKYLEYGIEKNIGISIFSFNTGRSLYSNNMLGKALRRIMGEETEFSSIHHLDLFKSMAIVFVLGILSSIILHIFNIITMNMIMLLTWILLSIIIGYFFYRRVYHVSLYIDKDGFTLKKGVWTYTAKWREFDRAWLHIDKGMEIIRIGKKEGYIDIPVYRLGLDRRALLSFIKDRIGE
jgi:hypothetical protein